MRPPSRPTSLERERYLGERGEFLWNKCLIAATRGDYRAALDYGEEGIDSCEKMGAWFDLGRLLNTVGWIHLDLGDLDRADDYDERSLAVITRHAQGRHRASPSRRPRRLIGGISDVEDPPLGGKTRNGAPWDPDADSTDGLCALVAAALPDAGGKLLRPGSSGARSPCVDFLGQVVSTRLAVQPSGQVRLPHGPGNDRRSIAAKDRHSAVARRRARQMRQA